MGSFWTFLLVLIALIWFVAVLADPVGPVWWGVAWIDLLIFGILFALLLAAATPSTGRSSHKEVNTNSTTEEDVAFAAVALSIWFWVMIFFFFLAAIIIAATY